MGVLSIFMQLKYFTASYLSFSGHSHIGSLFDTEELKKGGSEHGCHTCSCCHRPGQSDSANSAKHVFMTSKHQFLANYTLNSLKNCCECNFSFHLISVNRNCDVWIPFNITLCMHTISESA